MRIYSSTIPWSGSEELMFLPMSSLMSFFLSLFRENKNPASKKGFPVIKQVGYLVVCLKKNHFFYICRVGFFLNNRNSKINLAVSCWLSYHSRPRYVCSPFASRLQNYQCLPTAPLFRIPVVNTKFGSSSSTADLSLPRLHTKVGNLCTVHIYTDTVIMLKIRAADPGSLSRIADLKFYIPNPPIQGRKDTDLKQRIEVLLTQKTISNLSDPLIFHLGSGSRGQ